MPNRKERRVAFETLASQMIIIKDGPYGTAIQNYGLSEEDWCNGQSFDLEQKGNNDLLNLTRPDLITAICQEYLDSGAMLIATNSFNANAISQADYGLEDLVHDINKAAAQIMVEAARKQEERGRPCFVAGSLGPTNKTLSLSPDVNRPGYREVDFDKMKSVYRAQIDALLAGGVDFILIETVFDSLNAKAAIMAAKEAEADQDDAVPLMLSMTMTDRGGRNLSGQTVEAFWYTVRHARPVSMGLNCSFGASELRQPVADLSPKVDCLLSVYPNAGLPNALGGYDEKPEETASLLRDWAKNGLINIVGGCCGTTPAHIAAISKALNGIPPRPVSNLPPALRLAGMETVVL